MPPERKVVAKKSAPSQYNPPPLRHTSRRSASPMTLDDQLLYIERWGVNQFEGCRECRSNGLASRCFVASKVSPRCGNCLRAGKECHFPETIDSSEDDLSDDNQLMAIIQEDEVTIRKRGETRALPKPIMAENLVNYDSEDVVQSPLSVTSLNMSPKLAVTNPSLTKSPTPSTQKPPKTKSTRPRLRNTRTISSRHHTNPTPTTERIPSRMVTPPLAMAGPSSADYLPPVSPDQIRSSEISFTERNLVIMAIQEQVDWNAVATASGVGVDKAMKWWMKASSELVRRG